MRKVPLNFNYSNRLRIQFGNPQGIQFGNDGLYAFVISLIGPNYFRIGVWCVSDLQRCMYYDYQVIFTLLLARKPMLIFAQRERRDSTAPVPSVIPFPRLPFCILWDENGKVWFLRRQGPAAEQPTTQKDKLQAVAISPDENSVVFITSVITGFSKRSEISVSSLAVENESFSLSEVRSGTRLDKSLSHPKKSAVTVQAIAGGLRVIVAHSDGTHEIKEIRLG
jgi:hypothetical protein